MTLPDRDLEPPAPDAPARTHGLHWLARAESEYARAATEKAIACAHIASGHLLAAGLEETVTVLGVDAYGEHGPTGRELNVRARAASELGVIG